MGDVQFHGPEGAGFVFEKGLVFDVLKSCSITRDLDNRQFSLPPFTEHLSATIFFRQPVTHVTKPPGW